MTKDDLEAALDLARELSCKAPPAPEVKRLHDLLARVNFGLTINAKPITIVVNLHQDCPGESPNNRRMSYDRDCGLVLVKVEYPITPIDNSMGPGNDPIIGTYANIDSSLSDDQIIARVASMVAYCHLHETQEYITVDGKQWISPHAKGALSELWPSNGSVEIPNYRLQQALPKPEPQSKEES